MIFNKSGVPVGEVLWAAALWPNEHRKIRPGPKRPRAQRYTGAILRAIHAEKGVGRPPRPVIVWAEEKQLGMADVYRGLVVVHGSQRKAAAALGITLGKLQRELKKAAA